MLREPNSKMVTPHSLASAAGGMIGGACIAVKRHAMALVRAVQRDLARAAAVRALRGLSDGTLRDIGVTREQIPALVNHLLDESGLDEAATQAPHTPPVRRTRVDVRWHLRPRDSGG
jgi:uncharacterized protein YjiS (DUF1127 family)